MANLNKVMLIGNLTRDPELKYTPSGTAVAEMTLAVNRKFKQGDDWKEEACFVDVTVWSRQAENCAEYLKKGSQAFVEGRLKLDQWEQEGKKRSKLGVVAENVQFLSAKSGGGNRSNEYNASPEQSSYQDSGHSGPTFNDEPPF